MFEGIIIFAAGCLVKLAWTLATKHRKVDAAKKVDKLADKLYDKTNRWF